MCATTVQCNIVEAEEEEEQQVREIAVSTCWAFVNEKGCLVMTKLAQEQGLSRAACDTGFQGCAVVGKRRFVQLLAGVKSSGKGYRTVKRSNTKYRFGSGALDALSTHAIEVQIGQKWIWLEVDVVSGALPMLLGLEFLVPNRIVVDCDTQQIVQRCDRREMVLSRWNPGELPSIEVLGQLEHGSRVGVHLTAKVGGVSVAVGPDCAGEKNGGCDSEGETDTSDAEPDQTCDGSPGVEVDVEALGSNEEGVTKEEDWMHISGGKKKKVSRSANKKLSALAAEQQAEAVLHGVKGAKRIEREKKAAEKAEKGGKVGKRKVKEAAEREAIAQSNVQRPAAAQEAPAKVEKKSSAMVEKFEKWMKGWSGVRSEAEAEAEKAEDVAHEAWMKKKAEGEKRESKRPKVCDATLKELRKLHLSRHVPAAALIEFLKNACSSQQRVEWREELQAVAVRARRVCEECRGCQLREPIVHPGTSISRDQVKDYLGRFWVDLVCLDSSKGIWAVGVVDEATDDSAFCVTESKSAESVMDALFDRWFSIRGAGDVFVSDQARELLSLEELYAMLQSLGISQQVSGAGCSESHGRIERKFRVFRHALERELAVDRRPQTAREWRYFTYGWENAIRNTVLVGGFSSSQRAWGRGTTLFRGVLDDTPVTGAVSTSSYVRERLQFAELGRETFLKAVTDRKLRSLLSEETKPDVRIRQKNEEVWYRTGPQRQWSGPGRVLWYDDKQQMYCAVRGTREYHPGRYDVKGVNEVTVRDENPTKREEALRDEGGVKVDVELEQLTKQVQKDAQEQEARELEIREEVRATEADRLADARRRELLASTRRFERVSSGGWQESTEREGKPLKPTKPQQTGEAPWGDAAIAKRLSEEGQQKIAVGIAMEDSPCLSAGSGGTMEEDWTFDAPTAHDEPVTPKAVNRRRQGRQHTPVRLTRRTCGRNRKVSGVLFSAADSYGFDQLNYTPGVDVWAEQCLPRTEFVDAPGVETGVLVGVKAGADAYGMLWKDLDPEKQMEGRLAGVADYDKFHCWKVDEAVKVFDVRNRGDLMFGAHWVDKCKMVQCPLTGELVPCGKSRWTPHGYEEFVASRSETMSPTAQLLTHVLIEAIGESLGWDGLKFDVSSAFFQGQTFVETTGKRAWIALPPEEVARLGLPRVQGGWARELLSEVPGTKGAPRAWFEVLREAMLKFADEKFRIEQSRHDPCLFEGRDAKSGESVGAVGIHVDDGKGRATAEFSKWLHSKLTSRFKGGVKWDSFAHGETKRWDFVGVEWSYSKEKGVQIVQEKYVQQELREVKLSDQRYKQRGALVTKEEFEDVRSVNGCMRWASRTLPRYAYDVFEVSSICHQETDDDGQPQIFIDDVRRLNKIVRTVKQAVAKKECVWTLPRIDPTHGWEVAVVTDAGQESDGPRFDARWIGGRAVLLRAAGAEAREDSEVCLLGWRSGKVKRVSHSSFDGEVVECSEGIDGACAVAAMVAEIAYGQKLSRWERYEAAVAGEPVEDDVVQVSVVPHTDAKSLTTRVEAVCVDQAMKKSRKVDVQEIKEHVCAGRCEALIHIAGPWNPVDVLTKPVAQCSQAVPEWEGMVNGSWIAKRGAKDCPDRPDPYYGVPVKKARARAKKSRARVEE